MRLNSKQFQNLHINTNEGIPFVVHQTWKTESIPEENIKWVESWEYYNPDYLIVLWDDDSILNFIHLNYPQYIDLCYRFQRSVELADLFRYIVIYHFGGVYADLDVECLQSITPLLINQHNLFCCVEKFTKNITEKEYYKLVRQEQLCQWFFGAPKGSFVLKDLCDLINLKYPKKSNKDYTSTIYNTLESTGPGVFSDVILQEKKNKGNITIFPQYYFAIGACFTDGFNDDYPDWVEYVSENAVKEKLMYVRHHFQGSWKHID